MIFLLAALAALQAPPPEKGDPVSFRLIDRDALSGFQETQEKFITTLDEWIQLWARRQANLAKKKPHPAVDFDKEAVVVVSLGSKPTTGFSVEITRIVKTKEEIQIYVKETVPAEGSTPAAKPSSPFMIVRMPKPDRFVRFYEEPKK